MSRSIATSNVTVNRGLAPPQARRAAMTAMRAAARRGLQACVYTGLQPRWAQMSDVSHEAWQQIVQRVRTRLPLPHCVACTSWEEEFNFHISHMHKEKKR